jgi:hypothetical protein
MSNSNENEIAKLEHDFDYHLKKTAPYGWDGASYQALKADSDGRLEILNGSSLVPDNYDYIALTYVASGNGAGEIETVTYKDGGAGGTTIATLTLAYDASDNLSSVTKT